MIVLIFIIALLIDQTMIVDIYRNDQWEPTIKCSPISDNDNTTMAMDLSKNQLHVVLDCDKIFSDGFES